MKNEWIEEASVVAQRLDAVVPKESAEYDIDPEDEHFEIVGNRRGLARLAIELLRVASESEVTPTETRSRNDVSYAGPVIDVIREDSFSRTPPAPRSGWDILGLVGCALVLMLVVAIFQRGCSSLYNDVRDEIGAVSPRDPGSGHAG